MKVLYLDESGDHDLVNIDPAYPVFVLGGVILDRTYARTVMEPRVRAFKTHWFGTDQIVLHSVDIARGKRGFERLRSDRAFRVEFLAALSDLMEELDYRVVACVIHKDRHVERYGRDAPDPYAVALDVVVERFCLEIGDRLDGGAVYAERRRPDLDHGLDAAWERLRANGTPRLNEDGTGLIDERIIGFGLKAKSLNLVGLQLADLVISPIGRHQTGLDTHDNRNIVQRKVCRDRLGRVEGYGLVVLPAPGKK